MIKEFANKVEVKVSEKSVFRIIEQFGPVTKNEISKQLDSSLTTISRVLKSLEEKNLIFEEDKNNAVGRKALTYVINPNSVFSFGAYITPDLYGISVCNIGGEIIDRKEFPFLKDTEPLEVAEHFTDFIKSVKLNNTVNTEEILGTGLAVMGPIIKKKGIMYHPYHLRYPGWDLVSIRDLLEMKTGIKTWIDNLTEIALLSELIFSHKQEKASSVYVWMDRGVGCGIYSHGVLGLGSVDTSSSIGHIVIDFEGDQCVCGKRGCLETYASIDSIVKGIRNIYPEVNDKIETYRQQTTTIDDTWKSTPELLAVRDVFNESGTLPQVREHYDKLVDAIAAALYNFLHITRPQNIFYGGRTVELLDTLFHKAMLKTKEEYLPETFDDMKLIKSDFNGDLLFRGAAFLVFNDYLEIVRT
jgi:predicted NBD/HSP70 family sugar kinase